MATKSKKKTTKKSSSKQASSNFPLRLRPEVDAALRDIAGKASISLNQLIQGICEAAVQNSKVGEAAKKSGLITLNDVDGCVWFGDFGDDVYELDGKRVSSDELEMKLGPDQARWEFEGVCHLGWKGDLWFGLDYSGRGYRKA